MFALAIHLAIQCAIQHRGQLDCAAFYLDDGVVAGSAVAVRFSSDTFREKAEALGLTFAVGKCEVVPAAKDAFALPADVFGRFEWKVGGSFKLLGAPFGDEAFCAAHTATRVTKAEHLLKEIGAYDHTQGTMQLLRNCASWSKLV